MMERLRPRPTKTLSTVTNLSMDWMNGLHYNVYRHRNFAFACLRKRIFKCTVDFAFYIFASHESIGNNHYANKHKNETTVEK